MREPLLFLADEAGNEVPAGAEATTLAALLEAVHPEYRDAVAAVVAGGRRCTMFTALASSERALFVARPESGGVICQLIPLEDLAVPPGLGLSGVRRGTVHDLCNDLSAVRLNGELALRLIERDGGVVDDEALGALQALVRVTVEVEAGLRRLEQQLDPDLSGQTL